DGGGNPIVIYSSIVERRGLAKVVQQAPNIESLVESEDVGLAAYYDVGDLWANKPEAELRNLMVDGSKTPAVRRAATKALLVQLGRAFDVPCLQSLANGQECK
ncbi:MAG: hypothetical protein N3E42_05825, partial [Candidatus Bipolaricaulota bacterium]|nr:hypothetical protein [Candidatus Bipolaricaulota bacterium]